MGNLWGGDIKVIHSPFVTGAKMEKSSWQVKVHLKMKVTEWGIDEGNISEG